MQTANIQPAERLLTARDVAQRLGVSLPMAYRLMSQIGIVQLGRSKRVSRTALEKFIERSTQPPSVAQ